MKKQNKKNYWEKVAEAAMKQPYVQAYTDLVKMIERK